MAKKKVTYVSLLADSRIHPRYERALEKVEGELGRHYPMLIDGEEVSTRSEFDVRSPMDTGIVVASFPKGGKREANRAVRAAKASFKEWNSLDWKKRTRIIRRAADLLERKMFDLSALITYEVGKNRYEAVAEVWEAIDMMRYNASLYEKSDGLVVPMNPESETGESRSVMRPHGVWAIISPFNFPIDLAAGMASAALVTGNTAVLKPTSEAPLTGMGLYESFVEAGVPPGAVNLVTGPGGPFGESIVSNPDVDGIAFTGSRSVGMWLFRSFITQQAYPKPVVLEMGSKDPAIVTAKADLEKAAEGIVKGAFGYSGQKCSATSRVYIERPVFEEFTEILKSRTEDLVTGDPRIKETFVGPLINRRALETFRTAVADCQRAGGAVVTGGAVIDEGPLSRGFYATPTIVTGIPRDHRVMTEELFVPLVALAPVDSLEEAVREANDTDYGLTSGIFSESKREIDYYFDNIQFGVCYSNRRGGATTGAWPGNQSFGGWKASGATGKGVGGPYYLLSYVREQSQTRIR